MDHHIHGFDEQLVLISHGYPSGSYTQTQVPPPPQGGGAKPAVRRRRRKSKGTAGGGETEAGGPRKRKLSEKQANLLELSFGKEHKLESERKDRLASELGLDPRQVAVWFQNRRARWKNKKLEEEFSKLKTAHDNILLEKCQLESQVLQLKEQLSESEKEIGRLRERTEGTSSNSPTSSLSMEAIDAPFFDSFVPEAQYDNLFYVSENHYVPNMEWMNLYM